MNSVYIIDDTNNVSFVSLLVNDLKDRNIKFNTRFEQVDYNNVLVYIPTYDNWARFIDAAIRHNNSRKFHFNNIIVLTGPGDNDKLIRSWLTDSVRARDINFFQCLTFDTFVSKLITNSCVIKYRQNLKFHNK